jgi:hypothetical protein
VNETRLKRRCRPTVLDHVLRLGIDKAARDGRSELVHVGDELNGATCCTLRDNRYDLDTIPQNSLVIVWSNVQEFVRVY